MFVNKNQKLGKSYKNVLRNIGMVQNVRKKRNTSEWFYQGT